MNSSWGSRRNASRNSVIAPSTSPLLRQRVAETDVRDCVLGIQAQHLAVFRDLPVQIALARQRVAKVKVCI